MISKKDRIYLASPYTYKHEDPMEVVRMQDLRFRGACKAAGWLMCQGYQVFSPIAATHTIAVRCDLPKDFEYWEKYDYGFIDHYTTAFVVLALEGWKESVGVKAEFERAVTIGKTPHLMQPTAQEGYEVKSVSLLSYWWNFERLIELEAA